jgi:tetratricopeptide (TPR) repeat protein
MSSIVVGRLHRVRHELLLLLALLVVYANSFAGVFLYDDFVDVLGDPRVRHGFLSLPEFLGDTRSLVRYSFAINWALGGENPLGYHAVNLAIHAAATLLLFGLAKTTLLLKSMQGRYDGKAEPLAFAIALLWAVHPLQTESVTYIVQRYESFASLFYLLTVYAFARSETVDRSRSAAWRWLSVLACGLGMLCKEVAVTAPVVVLLYDRLFVAGSWAEIAARRGRYYLALAATWLFLVPSLLLVTRRSQAWVGFHLGTKTYLRNQPDVILRYLRSCFVPFPQCLDWGLQPARRAADTLPATVVVIAAGLATVVGILRQNPLAWLAAAFFLILSPTSSVLPLGELANEHRMYLASATVIAGVVIVGDAILYRMTRQDVATPRGAAVVSICLVVATATVLGLLTVRRNALYASSLAIWQDNARIAPDSATAHGNVAESLRDAGDIDGALAAFERCRAIDPHHLGLVQYADLLRQRNRLPEAIAVLQRVAESSPDSRPLEALGLALFDSGRVDEGLAALARATALAPERGQVRITYGMLLIMANRAPEAVGQFQAALAGNPVDERGLSGLLIAQGAIGNLDAAIATAHRLIAIRPGNADAHSRLGQLLLWKERPVDAARELEIAAHIDRRLPHVFENLATACEAAGRLDAAAAALAEAIAVHDEQTGPQADDETRRQLTAALEALRARAVPKRP